MDVPICVVDAQTLVDGIHQIQEWLYQGHLRLAITPNTLAHLQILLQPPAVPATLTKPKAGVKPAKREYPAFDLNPRIVSTFLDRVRAGQDGRAGLHGRPVYAKEERHDAIIFLEQVMDKASDNAAVPPFMRDVLSYALLQHGAMSVLTQSSLLEAACEASALPVLNLHQFARQHALRHPIPDLTNTGQLEEEFGKQDVKPRRNGPSDKLFEGIETTSSSDVLVPARPSQLGNTARPAEIDPKTIDVLPKQPTQTELRSFAEILSGKVMRPPKAVEKTPKEPEIVPNKQTDEDVVVFQPKGRSSQPRAAKPKSSPRRNRQMNPTTFRTASPLPVIDPDEFGRQLSPNIPSRARASPFNSARNSFYEPSRAATLNLDRPDLLRQSVGEGVDGVETPGKRLAPIGSGRPSPVPSPVTPQTPVLGVSAMHNNPSTYKVPIDDFSRTSPYSGKSANMRPVKPSLFDPELDSVRVLANTTRATFSSPRTEVQYVLKSGATREQSRGRGKLWTG